MLYKDPVDKNKTMLPSPEDLKFKVNKKKTLNQYLLFLCSGGRKAVLFLAYILWPPPPLSSLYGKLRNIFKHAQKFVKLSWSARRCPWNWKNTNFEKKIDLERKFFFFLCYPQDTRGFPKKKLAHSVQPFGQLAIYIQWAKSLLYR